MTGFFNMRDGVAYFFQNYSSKFFFILNSTVRYFRLPWIVFSTLKLKIRTFFHSFLSFKKSKKSHFSNALNEGFFNNFLSQKIELFKIYKMICFMPKSVKYKKFLSFEIKGFEKSRRLKHLLNDVFLTFWSSKMSEKTCEFSVFM